MSRLTPMPVSCMYPDLPSFAVVIFVFIALRKVHTLTTDLDDRSIVASTNPSLCSTAASREACARFVQARRRPVSAALRT